MYEDRLRNIKESMKRQKIYVFKDELEEIDIQQQKLKDKEDDENIFVIRNIGSLLGSNGMCLTLGMLSEKDYNKYILEDGL